MRKNSVFFIDFEHKDKIKRLNTNHDIFNFSCRKDKSKCLTEQIGPNKLDGLTKNPKLFSVSRQCKEWLQDDFNTAAPFREVII